MYAAIEAKLAAGETIILDGATGTELEARGAEMDGEAWCALATLTAPDDLRAVHEAYVEAGADIVTANTFATSRRMMRLAGREADTERVNAEAVRIAREAAEAGAARVGRPVAVAGSISTMRALVQGGDQAAAGHDETEDERREIYREQARLLAEAGVDLLIMEMMGDVDHAPLAVAAAAETGLPVWVGFSVRAHPDTGAIKSFRDGGPSFEAMIDAALAAGGQAIKAAGVMHSDAHLTGPALDILAARYSGPLMAYPESGHFEMPNWRFVDIMAPETLAEYGRDWRARGARIVGGCCGLGADHIAALARAMA